MPGSHPEPSIFARNVPGLTGRLAGSTVAVAGCGGLGSNVAVALVRAGIGRLILVDFDVVEPSNLNRQHYFQADIGRPKVEALADHLRAIHPAVDLDLHDRRLAPEDVPTLFADADLLVEAFDAADAKRWLIEAWCGAWPDRPVICASGLAGYGASETMAVRRAGQITVCGDQETDMAAGLCSARVGLAAMLQANEAIALLMKGKGS